MIPLALVVTQASLAKSVTFDEPAMPLGRLLPALGRSAGIDLTASGAVAKDVVLVRVRDRSLGEILKRIALEDGVEIEATKTGYRLIRTPASERKERSAALAGRIASLQIALDQTAQSLSQPADEAAFRNLYPALMAERARGGAGWVRSGAKTSRANLPSTRATMRAMLLVSPEILADLQEGDRIVYSNRPTVLQRPLPALANLLKIYMREQNAWSAAAARFGAVEPNEYADDPFRHIGALDQSPSRAVLTIRRTNSSDAAMAHLVILDAAGADLGVGDYGISGKEMQAGMAEFQKSTDATPFPLSSETKTLLEGLPKREGEGPARPDPAAVALLSEPEKHDPLSFAATDLLRDMADQRPLIAALPDSTWYVGLFTPGKPKRSDRRILGAMVEARDEDGWLLVHPREPEITRRNRVDRAALGRFVRTIVKEKRVPLDAYATYAWTASEAPSDIVGVPIAIMIGDGTFNPDADWHILRLFGSFSPMDRKTMLAGGVKDWATLSLPQRALASWIVSRNVRSISGAPGEAFPSQNLMMEPTELFAKGFDGLEIKLTSREDAPLLCDSTTKNVLMGWRRVIEPERVGSYLTMPNGPQFDRYGVAARTTYSLSLSARKGISTGAQLEDVRPPTTALKPLADLPEPIRAAIRRSLDQAEKQKSGGGGQASP